MDDETQSKAPEAVVDILKRAVSKSRELTEALLFLRLRESWPQVATGDLGQQAEVVDYKNYTLYLETASSSWAQQMVFLRPEIIAKYQALYPKIVIKDLKVKSTGALRPAKIVDKAKELSPEEQAVVEKSVELPENLEEFRQRMTSIMIKAKRSAKNDQRQICRKCGERFDALGETTVCPRCRDTGERTDQGNIREYLLEAPWSRFADLAAVFRDITEEDYHREKERAIKQTYDYIKQQSYSLANTSAPAPALQKHLRDRAVNYVMLRSGLTPDKINVKIIQEVLGERLFKLLQFLSKQ